MNTRSREQLCSAMNKQAMHVLLLSFFQSLPHQNKGENQRLWRANLCVTCTAKDHQSYGQRTWQIRKEK